MKGRSGLIGIGKLIGLFRKFIGSQRENDPSLIKKEEASEI